MGREGLERGESGVMEEDSRGSEAQGRGDIEEKEKTDRTERERRQELGERGMREQVDRREQGMGEDGVERVIEEVEREVEMEGGTSEWRGRER